MDYFSMKRKELQALCKEHNIPANSANSVLADKLSQLLNEKEKPATRKRACLKSSVETTNEDEPAVSKREVKKVRFSPNNEVSEYEVRSGKKHVATPIDTKRRRKSVATKVDKLVVDSDSTNELIDDGVQIPVKRSTRAQGRGAVGDLIKETNVVKEPEGNLGKVTRSKANILAKGNVVQPEESKQSKRPVKDVKKSSESVEETAAGRVRATRSKAQAVTDDNMGLDVNPQVKKKRGGQVAKDVQNVEPSDELMEIPARVTRSRQTSKEDVNKVVSNPKAEKKRTRREMKATDESSNSSNVAPEDKQELPKRKSLRTKENMDEDQGYKGEVVNGGRATRAKAQLAVNSGRDGKSRAEKKVVAPMEPKMVQKPEEPVKKAGGKNVNRRKSVMPSKNSKVVLHPEEPVNRRTRNTRSKSVMPEAQEEVNDEPEMADSPAVEKKQAKGKSVDVTKSGNVASELKTVVNATGSPKSRKRRETPVTEDQGIGTDYGTVADESARRSTRSAGKSEGKSAANKQAASVKTPTSGIGKQPAVKGELSEGNQRGTRQALRSGAATRGDSSNKRAKLSAPEQSNAKYSAVKSNKKGTPVSKLNFEPDEKVVETELTPAIDGSRSQITRSAIRSDKTAGSLKKPSRTSVKKQPIGDAQISTRKAAKFRPDPAVNTAPGRVTRSGIKDRGNASSYYAEKVEKKKPSRSAHKVQPLEDAQISSPEVAEASPNPDVDTSGVQSEVYNEENMVSGNTGDLSIPEMRLPTKVVEENVVSVSETAVVVESTSTVLGEKSSGAEPHSISNGSDAEARDVGEGMEVADASIEKSSIQFTPNVAKPETGATPCLAENLLSETQQKPLDLPSFGDEPLLVPNLSEIPLQPLSEVEVQIAVNSEKSDANEMDSAETGSVLKGQQTDVMVEEQVVSIEKTVVMEDDAAGVSLGDAENECDLGSHNINSSSVYHDSFEQPDVMSTKEVERPAEPSNIENGSEQGAEDGRASASTPLTAKLVSEDNDDTLGQATNDDKLQGLFSAENDIKDGMDAAHGSLMEPNVLPVKENITSDDVADVSVDAGDEPAKKLESDVVQSTGTVHHSPILGRSDNENDSPFFGKPDDESDGPVLGKFDGEDTQLVSEDNDVTPDQATDDDKLHSLYSAENDIKDGMDVAHGSLMEPNVLPAEENVTFDDVADVSVDAGNEPVKELESDVVQSTGTDVHQSPILGRSDDESDGPVLGKSDGEDANVNTGKECETDEGLNSEHLLKDPVLSGGDGDDEGVSTNYEHESNPKLNNNDVSDTSLGKNDDVNMTKQPEPTAEPSSFNDITETPYSVNDISVEDQKAHLKPLYGNDVFGTPVKGEDDVLVDAGNEPTKEIESDAVASTDSDVPNLGASGDENDNSIFGTSVLQKFDGEDANVNECETREGVNSDKEHLLQETAMSGGEDDDVNNSSIFGTSVSQEFDGEDANVNECVTREGVNSDKEHLLQETALSGGEDDDVNTDNEHESDQTLVTGNDDDFSMTKQPEPISEPSSSNDINETHFSGSDIPEEARDSSLQPLTGNDVIPIPVIGEDDVKDDTISVPKELETGLEPSNDCESLEVHVSGNVVVDDQGDEQDGESERHNIASNDSPGMDEEYVGDDLEPENNENTPAVTEILISSSHQESVRESNIARDGLGSTEVTDVKNDSGNEQITTRTSEIIEGVSKESESVYPGISDEQITEETNTAKEIDHASTSDHCLDGGSNLGVDEFDTQLVGDIDDYDYPNREGSPSIVFTQEFSASPTSSEENDRSKQGETQETDSCQGLGHYSFRIDEQKPISANESYGLDESRKDNRVSDINTSARASFFKEGSSSSAAGLVDSVKNFDKASGHMTEGKSTQVDVEENPNPNMNEEFFNWTGSPMKLLFTTPAAGQIQYVKDGQDDAVNFVNQDQYSSQESLFTMSATTTNIYAKGGQEGSVDYANLNHYSSLKSFFATPATATVSHAKGAQEDQVEFSNRNHYSSPATATVSHLQGGQDYAISSAFPANRCNQGERNMEDFTNKLFEDEADGSGKNHFEFRNHQFDFSAGAAGTGHHEASGLRENSTDSGSFEEEKETQLKGPKTGDNNSF